MPIARFDAPTVAALCLKARWAVDERETLDLLIMVSVLHRRLEGGARPAWRRLMIARAGLQSLVAHGEYEDVGGAPDAGVRA